MMAAVSDTTTLQARPPNSLGRPDYTAMSEREFFEKVEQHPHLRVVYLDPTMCILRYTGPGGPRAIRVGMWAVRQFCWERLLEAFRIPVDLPQT